MKFVYNDAPERWQLGFQDEATPIAAGIIDFHNDALYYLIIIFTIVTYFVLSFSFRFVQSRSLN
jgi:heme/copper-type cytochrome/quinol oxidase subunit 2